MFVPSRRRVYGAPEIPAPREPGEWSPALVRCHRERTCFFLELRVGGGKTQGLWGGEAAGSRFPPERHQWFLTSARAGLMGMEVLSPGGTEMCVLLQLKCPLWGMTLLWVNGEQCFSSLTNILEYYIKLFLSHQNGY